MGQNLILNMNDHNFVEFAFFAKLHESTGHSAAFIRQSTADSVTSANGSIDVEWRLMDPSFANPFHLVENGEVNGAIDKTNDKEKVCDEDSDDSDVPEELTQECLDDGIIDNQKPQHVGSFKRHHSYKAVDKMTPFVCNSSLNLLRLFGRYLHIANIVGQISFDVITWLSQLLDYYFKLELYGVSVISEKLESALNRLRNNINVLTATYFGDQNSADTRWSFCRLSHSVDLTNPETLYGLPERILGIESLVFITKQLINLKPVIEELIPSTKKPFIQQFYMHTVNVATELRRPVYGFVSEKAINYEYILHLVSSTNWEISELMSQHNPYVDYIVKEMDGFRHKLLNVTRRIHVPRETYDILWDVNIRIGNRVLVEGLSNAKKCTHEGRALMQLDYQQLLLKLESLATIRPIPDKELVESYIKAFYLPESSMEQWISEHKEYSSKQIISLLHIATHISKKTRQRVINSLQQHDIEEIQ